MTTLEEVESQALGMLLSGDDPALATLRAQAAAAVSARRATGVGFFTRFNVPENVARLNGLPSFKLGDVNGTAKNVKHGLGFLLSVKDGALTMFEGYTYDEPWPPEIEGLALSYSGPGATRDWARVLSLIRGA